MSSASSVNPGVQSLLQTLSNVNSPVLSSSKVVSALDTAPASDIVQLSAAATQLENMDALFGVSDGSSASTSSPFSSVENLLTASESSAATTSADQLADYQATLQALQTQDLFGAGTANGLTDSLLNVTG
jgi:hypothetical protein